jgi:ACT domain-containing protein
MCSIIFFSLCLWGCMHVLRLYAYEQSLITIAIPAVNLTRYTFYKYKRICMQL